MRDLRKAAIWLGLIGSVSLLPLSALAEVKLTDEQKTKIEDAVKENQDKMKTAPRGDRAARQAIACPPVDALLQVSRDGADGRGLRRLPDVPALSGYFFFPTQSL